MPTSLLGFHADRINDLRTEFRLKYVHQLRVGRFVLLFGSLYESNAAEVTPRPGVDPGRLRARLDRVSHLLGMLFVTRRAERRERLIHLLRSLFLRAIGRYVQERTIEALRGELAGVREELGRQGFVDLSDDDIARIAGHCIAMDKATVRGTADQDWDVPDLVTYKRYQPYRQTSA